LPTRASVMKMGAFQAFYRKFPGEKVFVENLPNVKKARPQITAYPRISQVLGQAIVSVILGKSEPQPALAQAAQQANTILATRWSLPASSSPSPWPGGSRSRSR